jgi:hypothetical protein
LNVGAVGGVNRSTNQLETVAVPVVIRCIVDGILYGCQCSKLTNDQAAGDFNNVFQLDPAYADHLGRDMELWPGALDGQPIHLTVADIHIFFDEDGKPVFGEAGRKMLEDKVPPKKTLASFCQGVGWCRPNPDQEVRRRPPYGGFKHMSGGCITLKEYQ